jgi:citronellol/citronellal dehydrogenase
MTAATLAGKTLFVTGASRGIGKAIALRASRDGANIVVAAKTDQPHPKLSGTIYTAADEIERAGGKALPVRVDVRDEAAVAAAVRQAAEHFGGIDILVNNASAIQLTGTLDTPIKRFDLLHAVNVRGTFLCSQKVIPYLRRALNPHILNLAPPLVSTLQPRWFAPHLAYTIAKYGMTLCVLGMAEEFRSDGIAVNALWPRSVIDTEALRMVGAHIDRSRTRSPEIVADAAHVILTNNSRSFTGRCLIDEDVLREAGVTGFSSYRSPSVDTDDDLLPDFFV